MGTSDSSGSPIPPTQPPTPPPTPPSPSKHGQPSKGGSHIFQSPTGTRDFYPAELNRLRYIQDAWRRTSINHGFEEIDGPTFEHLDLYTVKSGEGIVSELFSFERFGGEKTFALRPEFTPTLARMYAAKAASLPKPTKWFWQQNCYRAERPQRGRLREFCQWNCDIVGEQNDWIDAELIAVCVGMLESLGLTHKDVRVRINDRGLMEEWLLQEGVPKHLIGTVFTLADKRENCRSKPSSAKPCNWGSVPARRNSLLQTRSFWIDFCDWTPSHDSNQSPLVGRFAKLQTLRDCLASQGVLHWCEFDPQIARGLAYYTGMVFEVHEATGAERAIAGGGRYDKLIEMFGGPPTPAVGFGMGDVVLSLVLQDKGLMPKDEEMGGKLGLNPDALVISNGTPEADAAVAGVVASLRRAGLHARRSYKTTKNIGKLIQDGAKMRPRYCVILESADRATVKNLATQGQEECGVGELAAKLQR